MAPFDGDITQFEQVTKPDVFSVEAFRDWLATMPAEKEYDFWDCAGECLAGQYLKAQGIAWNDPRFKGLAWNYLVKHHRDMADVCGGFGSTFGAALDRCNAFLKGEGR